MSAVLLLTIPVLVALVAVFYGSDSRQLGTRRPDW